MKDHHPVAVGAEFFNHLQRAGGRRVAVDLRIAFIGENQEIIFLGQRDQIGPIVARGDNALRIGGGAKIGRRGAAEHLFGQAGEIGQMPGLGGGGDHDGLCPARDRADHIDLVERVRHQNRRFLPVLGRRAERDDGVIQPLAGAVQRHNLAVGVHFDPVAAGNPCGDGTAQLGRAVVWRVLVKAFGVFRDLIRNPSRKRMFRLANGHMDRRATTLMPIEQGAQARPHVGRKVRKPLGIHHQNCLGSGSFAPRLPQGTQGRLSRPEKPGDLRPLWLFGRALLCPAQGRFSRCTKAQKLFLGIGRGHKRDAA